MNWRCAESKAFGKQMTEKAKCIPIHLHIPIPAMPDGQFTMTPTLFHTDDDLILVDTGMPGMMKDIAMQLETAGYSPGELTGILLTHQDIDHIGSAAQLKTKFPDIEIYAHDADKPYIQGELPLLKTLPKPLAAQMSSDGKQTSGLTVTHTVTDGDQLAGGLTVIHTPGHTPGHISLYHPASKTLITGDALIVRGGELQGPNPPQTPDMEEAYRSVAKLASYDIEKVICYHGGLYDRDVNRKIAQIAAAGPPLKNKE